MRTIRAWRVFSEATLSDIHTRIVEMTVKVNRIASHAELSMKQFQIACESNDAEKMEEARIASHEYLDQLLDIQQEITELKERQTQEVLKSLRRGR